MTTYKTRPGFFAALLVLAFVTACGDGSSTPDPTPTPRATASTAPATEAAPVASETPVSQATATPAPPTQAAPTSTSAATETGAPAEIQIEGSPDFVAWTEQALQLLQAEAPDWYEQVYASIRAIRSVPAGSGMDVFNKVYLVGDITAYAPGFTPARQLFWYAGTIVHDSCHSERYDEGLVYLGKEGEVACLVDQKAALLLLDTNPYFSDYVQSLIDGADDPENAYWTNPVRHW